MLCKVVDENLILKKCNHSNLNNRTYLMFILEYELILTLDSVNEIRVTFLVELIELYFYVRYITSILQYFEKRIF